MEKSNNTLSGQKWHNNPRTLSEQQHQVLKESIEELGDLSGVVHDLNSNQYVGGNQRSAIFGAAEVVLTETFEPPTRTGTVAVGYIDYEGERFQYRQVRWDEEKCRKALILANAAGGSWDMETLANEFDDLDLKAWGVPVPTVFNDETDAGDADYTEKQIDAPIATDHTCPKCGHEF